MSQPMVSVIIPVYNGEKYIAAALESVQRQRYEPVETIIVDDGSTDKTKEVIERLQSPVRYSYQQNSGPALARNAGLRSAKGEFVTFLDADDLWAETKLEIQTSLLTANPAVDIVLGQVQLVQNEEQGGGLQKLGNPGIGTVLSASLIRARSFEKIGMLDESMRYDDDVDWFLRAKEGGLSIMHHSDVVLLYRRHAANITNNAAANNKHFILAFKKSLERRRQTGNEGVKQPDH